jgi:hypothetical protein
VSEEASERSEGRKTRGMVRGREEIKRERQRARKGESERELGGEREE